MISQLKIIQVKNPILPFSSISTIDVSTLEEYEAKVTLENCSVILQVTWDTNVLKNLNVTIVHM